MVSLTPQQRCVLDHLLHGATGRSRSKHIPALHKMGYICSRGHPTTAAWHEFGEYRFRPQLKIPLDWEVDTWEGQLIMAQESPEEYQFDPHGPSSWSHSKNYTFILSIHRIMQFYRDCIVAAQAHVDEHWTEAQDELCSRNGAVVFPKLTGRTRDHAETEAQREGIRSVCRLWGCPNTGVMLYNWAHGLYTTLQMQTKTTVSFKHCLQRNMDEIQPFLYRPSVDQDKLMFYAQISVD